MNLDEIREIVDFMKENGLCELEYREKNSAVRLKLAPPPFHGEGVPCPPPPHEAPEEELYPDEEVFGTEASEEAEPFFSEEKREEMKQAAAEVKQAAAEAAAGVKKATYKAAGAAGEHLGNVADYLKSKRDEHLAGGTPGAYDVDLEIEDMKPEETEGNDTPSNPYEGLLDENDISGEEAAPETAEPVTLDTESAKVAAKRAAEAVGNTAKAGYTLGKAGLQRGKTFLSDLIGKKDETVAAVHEETVWGVLYKDDEKDDNKEDKTGEE